MKNKRIYIKDKKLWLEKRINYINSTEIAILFNLSSYCTRYQLFLLKKNKVIDDIDISERMHWGLNLESIIATKAAEKLNLKIRKCNAYIYNDEFKIGSSFDYIGTNANNEKCILEIKNVDNYIFKNKFIEKDNNIEASAQIELQVQHQMLLRNIDQAYICLLVGGNELKTIHRKADKEIQEKIKIKVADFWKRINNNDCYEPNDKDETFIKNNLEVEDKEMQANESQKKLIKKIHEITQKIIILGKEKKELTAKLFLSIKNASSIVCEEFKANILIIKESAGKLVTSDMVNTYINARKESKRLTIKQI